MLDRIKIASPCSADWDLMKGDDQVRFCSHCEKHVYNLSAMSRRDAERFVRDAKGRVCTRFYQRADGMLLTEDCPVGLKARAARLRQRLEFALSGILGLSGIAFGQTPQKSDALIQVEQNTFREIRGTVKDPLGTAIPNAVVTLLDPKTGVSLAVRANARGEFVLKAREAVVYSLTVDVPGFIRFRRDRLAAKENTELEVTMQVPLVMGEVVTAEKHRF